MIVDRVMIKDKQAEFPLIFHTCQNKPLYLCTYTTSSVNKRQGNAAEREPHGLNLQFTGSYCFRGDLGEEMGGNL